MPRVNLNQTNFTGGEISPEMLGRVDIERYNSSCKTMTNAFGRTQGGAQGREGTKFITGCFDNDERSRLIPFVFSRSQAYALEFSAGKMRVVTAAGEIVMDGITPYSIDTPFNSDETLEFDYAQTSDTMFIVHPNFPVQRLRRFSDTYWDLSETPFVNEPTIEQGFKPAQALTLSSAAVGTGVTATAAGAVFLASDVGRDITYQAGLATITGFTSSTVVTVEIIVAFIGTALPIGWVLEGSPQTTCTPSAYTPAGATISLSLSADGWRSDEVGKIVSINGGLIEITAYTSATSVDGTILVEPTSATGAPKLAWELQSSMWSDESGYPACVCFYEQRLILSGVPKFPRHVFGSEIGNTLDFLIGVDDTDAFAFPIAVAQDVRFVSPVNYLIALGYDGEFVMQGGVEKPITPTNVTVKSQSAYGSSTVKPVRIANELFFAQRAGKKLRAFAYRYTEDIFDAPEMTKLSQHITSAGISELTYQQEPYGRILAVLTDGDIACCTIDRVENVICWSKWQTQGEFESVCTVPYQDKDVTFCTVKRGDNRYIEQFDESTYLDSAVTVSGSGTDYSGFESLADLDVKLFADGIIQPEVTVNGSGEITLQRAAATVTAGLEYIPELHLLPIEFPTGQGTAQGANGSVSEVVVRLYNTGPILVDNNLVTARRFGGFSLNESAEPFTEDVSIPTIGWKKNAGDITIRAVNPGPFHVLSVKRQVTVND